MSSRPGAPRHAGSHVRYRQLISRPDVHASSIACTVQGGRLFRSHAFPLDLGILACFRWIVGDETVSRLPSAPRADVICSRTVRVLKNYAFWAPRVWILGTRYWVDLEGEQSASKANPVYVEEETWRSSRRLSWSEAPTPYLDPRITSA